MDHDIAPETTNDVEETGSKAEEILSAILDTLKNQGEQISKLTEHMLKLKVEESVKDIANEPDVLTGDALETGEKGIETGIQVASVPPDVIKDTLHDTDKGLKEIKPKKRRLFE